MAKVLSPNGNVKKHNLYNKQPSACNCYTVRDDSVNKKIFYPNISFSCNWFTTVHVHHLWRPITQRRVPFNLLFHTSDPFICWIQDFRGRRSKITYHVVTVFTYQNIFYLKHTRQVRVCLNSWVV
jgi:hypothetical protein